MAPGTSRLHVRTANLNVCSFLEDEEMAPIEMTADPLLSLEKPSVSPTAAFYEFLAAGLSEEQRLHTVI